MSGTRKVVINACYGGFGLSWEAMQKIAARKGLVASYFSLSPDIHRKVYGDQPIEPDETFAHRVIGPRAITAYPDGDDHKEFMDAKDLPRDDADVVAVVERHVTVTALSQRERRAVTVGLVALTACASPEERAADSARLEADRMRTANVATARRLPPRAKYEHGYRITTEYDRFADVTSVALDPMRIAPSLRLYARFFFSGKVLAEPPDQVSLNVMSENEASFVSGVLLLDDTTRVYLIADKPSLLWSLVDIVEATKVEGRFTDASYREVTFTLTPQHIAALRDFASRARPDSVTSPPS